MERLPLWQFISGGLALIVLIEATIISGKLLPLLKKSSLEKLPPEVQEQLVIAAKKDIHAVTSKKSQPTAFITITAEPNSDPAIKTAAIWLETTQTVRLSDLSFTYPQDKVSIIDSNVEASGVQVEFGEADVYLINEVSLDSGAIKLLVPFENGFSGRVLLAKVNYVVNDINSEPSFLTMEYAPKQLHLSSVKDYVTGENILQAMQPFPL